MSDVQFFSCRSLALHTGVWKVESCIFSLSISIGKTLMSNLQCSSRKRFEAFYRGARSYLQLRGSGFLLHRYAGFAMCVYVRACMREQKERGVTSPSPAPISSSCPSRYHLSDPIPHCPHKVMGPPLSSHTSQLPGLGSACLM